ncbi:hypothetical protein KAJ27_17070 [bacterium]|nr:hypothetical protein [Bacteroidales bacterium]MCK5685847.1 hypothetical protein [bacterium]
MRIKSLSIIVFLIAFASSGITEELNNHSKLSSSRMILMSIGGIGGSILGVGVIGLPFFSYYANNVGSYENAVPMTVLFGSFIFGNAIGTYTVGNFKAEQKGKFLPTLLGSVAGFGTLFVISPMLSNTNAGFLFFLPVPIGGDIGFVYSLRSHTQNENMVYYHNPLLSDIRVPRVFTRSCLVHN